MKEKEIPNTEIEVKKSPARKPREKKLPGVGNPENTVMIGEMPVEIKPTKLKYHRNNVAAFYKIVDMVPLPDILSMNESAFGDGRDGDKALMDWLIAVTDNPDLVTAHYDEMDTGTIEQLLTIFRRVNRIDEKEQKLKNLQTARKA